MVSKLELEKIKQDLLTRKLEIEQELQNLSNEKMESSANSVLDKYELETRKIFLSFS